MNIINFSEQNTILNQYMAELRDKSYQRNRLLFRNNIRRIGEMMAFELSKTLTYKTKTVTTPLATIDIPVPKDDLLVPPSCAPDCPSTKASCTSSTKPPTVSSPPTACTPTASTPK